MATTKDGGLNQASQVEIQSLNSETSLSTLRALLIVTSPEMNKACQEYLAARDAIQSAKGDDAAMSAAVDLSCATARKLAAIKSNSIADLRAKWTVLDIEAGDLIEQDHTGVDVWNGIDTDLEQMSKPAHSDSPGAASDAMLAKISDLFSAEQTRVVTLMCALEHVAMLSAEYDDNGNCWTYNTFAAAAKSIADGLFEADSQLYKWMVAAGKAVQP